MKCPHCRKELPDTEIARHLAAKGGRKSRRTITPDQQRAMQAARGKKGGCAKPTTKYTMDDGVL